MLSLDPLQRVAAYSAAAARAAAKEAHSQVKKAGGDQDFMYEPVLKVRKTGGNFNIPATDPKVRKAGGDFDMASDIYKGATHFGNRD